MIILFNKLVKLQVFKDYDANFLFHEWKLRNSWRNGGNRQTLFSSGIDLSSTPRFYPLYIPHRGSVSPLSFRTKLPLPSRVSVKSDDSCRRRNVFDDFPRLVWRHIRSFETFRKQYDEKWILTPLFPFLSCFWNAHVLVAWQKQDCSAMR